jgi:hypothetical protein
MLSQFHRYVYFLSLWPFRINRVNTLAGLTIAARHPLLPGGIRYALRQLDR